MHRRKHIGQAEQKAATPTLGQGRQESNAEPTRGGTPAKGLCEASRACRGGAASGAGPCAGPPLRIHTGVFRAEACQTLPGTSGRTAQGRAPGSCPPAGGVKSYGHRCVAVCCAGYAVSELVSVRGWQKYPGRVRGLCTIAAPRRSQIIFEMSLPHLLRMKIRTGNVLTDRLLA